LAGPTRKRQRFLGSLPVRIKGDDAEGNPIEIFTKTINVSATGAVIKIDRPMKPGLVLWISLPLPVSWRDHSFTDPSYNTHCEVIWVADANGLDAGAIGVKFITESDAETKRKRGMPQNDNKSAPKPKRFKDRRDPRFLIPIDFTIQGLNEYGQAVFTETTVAEDVSKRGARLLTTQQIKVGDIILVSAFRDGFKSLAVVRGTYVGKDGIRRINVEFSGNEFSIA